MARSRLAATLLCCLGGEVRAQDPGQELDDDLVSGLSFGGELEQNFDLGQDADDDLNLLGAELQLELAYRFNPYLPANLLLTTRQEYALPDEGGGDLRSTELIVEDAYLTLAEPDRGLALQLGRRQPRVAGPAGPARQQPAGGDRQLHYYGEALDPELSNLSIFTAGIGVTPRDDRSLDLLFHHYRQDEACDEVSDWALDADPAGEHRRLGSALDLVLGFLPLEELQLSAYLGWFMPGSAFADDPLFVRLEAQYEF